MEQQNKYCIKRTPENAEVLNKWANTTDKDGYYGSYGFILSIGQEIGLSTLQDDPAPEGFTELFTTEEFFAKVNYTPGSNVSNSTPLEHQTKQESERIPFDLEKWKTGKYDVVTRNDWNVYIIKTDLNSEWRKPLVGVLCYGEIGKAKETVCTWSINGEEHVGDRPTDLFLIRKTETVWVNHFESKAYETFSNAKFMAQIDIPNDYKYIETIEVKRPVK